MKNARNASISPRRDVERAEHRRAARPPVVLREHRGGDAARDGARRDPDRELDEPGRRRREDFRREQPRRIERRHEQLRDAARLLFRDRRHDRLRVEQDRQVEHHDEEVCDALRGVGRARVREAARDVVHVDGDVEVRGDALDRDARRERDLQRREILAERLAERGRIARVRDHAQAVADGPAEDRDRRRLAVRVEERRRRRGVELRQRRGDLEVALAAASSPSR